MWPVFRANTLVTLMSGLSRIPCSLILLEIFRACPDLYTDNFTFVTVLKILHCSSTIQFEGIDKFFFNFISEEETPVALN